MNVPPVTSKSRANEPRTASLPVKSPAIGDVPAWCQAMSSAKRAVTVAMSPVANAAYPFFSASAFG